MKYNSKLALIISKKFKYMALDISPKLDNWTWTLSWKTVSSLTIILIKCCSLQLNYFPTLFKPLVYWPYLIYFIWSSITTGDFCYNHKEKEYKILSIMSNVFANVLWQATSHSRQWRRSWARNERLVKKSNKSKYFLNTIKRNFWFNCPGRSQLQQKCRYSQVNNDFMNGVWFLWDTGLPTCFRDEYVICCHFITWPALPNNVYLLTNTLVTLRTALAKQSTITWWIIT